MSVFGIKIRIEVLKMLKHCGFGHLGGSLSLVEVMSVLYDKVMNINPKNPLWEHRDYFILSKGHAGPVVYATLALKGYFPLSDLLTLNSLNTKLPSHVDRLKTKGIDMTTGSLGQGLSNAVGVAKALKIQKKENKVFVIVGDGELNEGQCYEAMQFASHHKLDNLMVFVDKNNLQLDGFTKDICDPLDIKDKFESFGFHCVSCNGHDEKEILSKIDLSKSISSKPSCIILDTIKGNGFPFFENKAINHHVRFAKQEIEMLDEIILKLESQIYET
jgi:transketolase